MKEVILYFFCFFRCLYIRWYVCGKGYNNFLNLKIFEKKIYRKRFCEFNDNEKYGKINILKVKVCEWILWEMNMLNFNEYIFLMIFGYVE